MNDAITYCALSEMLASIVAELVQAETEREIMRFAPVQEAVQSISLTYQS